MGKEKVELEIAKTRRAIRKKYRALKTAEDTSSQLFVKAFKPIINPLESIEKKMIKPEKKEKKEEIKWEKSHLDDMEELDNSINESKEMNEELNESSYELEYPSLNESKRTNLSQSIRDEMPVGSNMGLLGRTYASYMINNSHDSVYGPHIDNHDQMKMGNYRVTLLPNDDIKIGERTFAGTEGLYQLIFEKEPQHLTKHDYNNYKTVFQLTGKHLR